MTQETPPHRHQVTIYYEDTDLSGYVYHPNYLKYFERAREHLLGVKKLANMYRDTGVGFVVYRCEMTFKAPARHGDVLDIYTTPRLESTYRLAFDQRVELDGALLVSGEVEMVCVDPNGKLVALPQEIVDAMPAKR